jgi:hypothetical protein
MSAPRDRPGHLFAQKVVGLNTLWGLQAAKSLLHLQLKVVLVVGREPARLSALPPQRSVSANSTIAQSACNPAGCGFQRKRF